MKDKHPKPGDEGIPVILLTPNNAQCIRAIGMLARQNSDFELHALCNLAMTSLNGSNVARWAVLKHHEALRVLTATAQYLRKYLGNGSWQALGTFPTEDAPSMAEDVEAEPEGCSES